MMRPVWALLALKPAFIPSGEDGGSFIENSGFASKINYFRYPRTNRA